MTTVERLAPGTLCAVCDDLATGNHYSVPSCNGCKTFFRRAIVNKRNFVCEAQGNCPVNKGVRCACRACRLTKCLSVGMDPNSIQGARDRIGYTKRTRRQHCASTAAAVGVDSDPGTSSEPSHAAAVAATATPSLLDDQDSILDILWEDEDGNSNFGRTQATDSTSNETTKFNSLLLERLTRLENTITVLLLRDTPIVTYSSLEEALNAPSCFSIPSDFKMIDEQASMTSSAARMDDVSSDTQGHNEKFVRARVIALYIEWAKTFYAFQKLPQSDKVALIRNHASSYMIISEAFRNASNEETTKSAAKFENELEKKQRKMSMEPPSTITNTSPPPTVTKTVAMTQMSASMDPACGLLATKFTVPSMLTDSAMSLMSSESTGPLMSTDPMVSLMDPMSIVLPELDMNTINTTVRSTNSIDPPSSVSSVSLAYHPQLRSGGAAASNDTTTTQIREIRDGGIVARMGGNDTAPFSPFDTSGSLTLSGLDTVRAIVEDFVAKPFIDLNVSLTEVAVLQALMFFDPDAEGLDAASQRNVAAEQKKFIAALHDYISAHYATPEEISERFTAFIMRISVIKKAAIKNRDSLEMLDICSVSLTNLVKETVTAPSPAPTLSDRRKRLAAAVVFRGRRRRLASPVPFHDSSLRRLSFPGDKIIYHMPGT